MDTRPRRIGLTGGIACGKSTVAECFKALGVPVIDADEVARQVVEPGQSALAEIREAFGKDVFLQDGSLDRVKLRRLIFAETRARRNLEAILHPRIRAEMQKQAEIAAAAYCILCVPLLIEAGQTDMVERILVVDCTPEQQRRRLAQRDQISAVEIERILQAQCDRERRLRYAHDVIHNTTVPADVRKAVTQLHGRYMIWAGARDG